MTLLSLQAPQPANAWEEDDRLATRCGAVVLEKVPDARTTEIFTVRAGKVTRREELRK